LGLSFSIGARLPLYAYKRIDKDSSGKAFVDCQAREPPVAFLDSLLLGEVILISRGQKRKSTNTN